MSDLTELLPSANITVALVQFDISWLTPELNIQKIDDLLENVNADLICLPETFATGFAFELAIAETEPGRCLQFMVELAKRKQAVVAGSVAVHSNQGKKANRLYWVKPNGDVQFYDKHHLFRMGDEQQHVNPGQQRVIVEINGVRVLLAVCYDLRFPVWARNQNDYDVYLNVANWPAARRKHWQTLLAARAIENQCYAIGVNRIGVDGRGTAHNGGTTVYDFSGDVIAQANDLQTQVVCCELNIAALHDYRQRFPAHLDRDPFQLL